MVGFVDTILAGVETAFTLSSEFVVSGTYTKKSGNADYDPSTDELVAENSNVFTNVRFLKTALSRQEREASPLSVQDAKFLVPAVDLPLKDPGENDFFVLATGERWNVLTSKFVPGDVIHIIFGRRA
jgi:hypothetical protein